MTASTKPTSPFAIIAAWAFVSLLLGYGLWNTALKAAQLFIGH
ncbi:MAG: hypothetical protein Q4B08_01665 [Propionibacteriaceae bacterium]|nr:hypothetical protein [Propionibacteriaceae bacterium]